MPQKPCKKCNETGSIKCPRCNGDGSIKDPGTPFNVVTSRPKRCPRCKGSGEIPCPKCNGAGHIDYADDAEGPAPQ